jgi:hypothetical protein
MCIVYNFLVVYINPTCSFQNFSCVSFLQFIFFINIYVGYLILSSGYTKVLIRFRFIYVP